MAVLCSTLFVIPPVIAVLGQEIQEGVVLRVRVEPTEANVGDKILAEILVEGLPLGVGSGIGAFNFELVYDQAMLEAAPPEPNRAFLESTGNAVNCDLPPPDSDREPDNLDIGAAYLGCFSAEVRGEGPRGDGVLGVVELVARKPGTGDLTLRYLSVGDTTGFVEYASCNPVNLTEATCIGQVVSVRQRTGNGDSPVDRRLAIIILILLALVVVGFGLAAAVRRRRLERS